MTAHENLKKRVRVLEEELKTLQNGVLNEFLDYTDPKKPVSRLDTMENAIKELQAWHSRGFWRRLLHLKPAKHTNVLKIGGNDEKR